MKVATFIFFSFKHGMIEMVIIMKKILIVEDDESIADWRIGIILWKFLILKKKL